MGQFTIPNEAPTAQNRSGIAPVPQKPRVQPPAWKMPPVRQGLQVRWFADRLSDDYHIGFVSEVGDRSVGVTLMIPGSTNVMPYTGVRHRSDPQHDAIDATKQGVWDYVDDGRDPLNPQSSLLDDVVGKVNMLIERVREQDARIAELEAAMTAPPKTPQLTSEKR